MKPVTVEQAFERWWAKYGAKSYAKCPICAEELERIRSWSRAAWHNGYTLGQRRTKARLSKEKP